MAAKASTPKAAGTMSRITLLAQIPVFE